MAFVAIAQLMKNIGYVKTYKLARLPAVTCGHIVPM